MSSAAKDQLGGLYINCREAIPARHALIAMGHHQSPTPVQTNNTTALGIVNKTIAPRRTNAMVMRFRWLHNRFQQQLQFCHYWQPGPCNKGDYVTKHHATIHHTATRSIFLTPRTTLDSLRMRTRALLKRSTAMVC